MVIIKNIEASVLEKLKNKSKKENIPLQQLLNLFCQEEFIRRLSKSPHNKNLILKGGFLLYAISNFTTRATIDADYLLRNYSNDMQSIGKLIEEIIVIPSKNEFIKLEIKNMELINEIKEYHGIRANLIGSIGRTRTPFSIDFGVGDVIIPSAIERTLPVLLPEFDKPTLLTYSLESIIAEKLDSIISLMEASGRMKDFYDIYYLATTFNFEGVKLQEAIYETLANRGTSHEDDSIIIIKRLTEDKEIQKRWDNFCKKILKYELDFNNVVDIIIDFIFPPYDAMIKGNELFKKWSYQDKKYI
ncbi:MAG: nucleotidyl transferase AbiEii/AbiGii toxin family protein [Gudongella sp.]|nr:nucleotidyl transferase AbiEii/AbiGii toxin family protein [Gudongella sp.]